MFGRDVVKFILCNELLDKELSDQNCLQFKDNLEDDSTVSYELDDRGSIYIYTQKYIEEHDEWDLYTKDIQISSLDDFNSSKMSNIESSMTKNTVIDNYNSYSCTFKSWLKSRSESESSTWAIQQYATSDPNFTKNSKSYNQLISYLETNECSDDIIQSAETAWTQYMRECRIIPPWEDR